MRFSLFLTFALAASALHAGPSITVYNQKFGLVRDTVPLALEAGETAVEFSGVTTQLEPESVILRDPEAKIELTILEQSYRADPVSEGLLLDLNEGKEIEFLIKNENKPDEVKIGKIIRSGYAPKQSQPRYDAYGRIISNPVTPIIQIDGKLRFSLPGEPIFPALADDTILQPTLGWKIHSPEAKEIEAEISYLTGGMEWKSDYNVVAPEQGDEVEIVGWVTIRNNTGKTFQNADIQLIAGDVAKLKDPTSQASAFAADPFADVGHGGGAPQVTEKSFDEYHLYTLPVATTLRDSETKQVEFVRSSGVKTKRLYIYDGAFIDSSRYRGRSMQQYRHDENYGTESNPKVWVMREIENTEDNNLGIPLPMGKVRFYRQDDENQLQFIGEDRIDHTPRDETLRLYTGNAFDLVGERVRTNFENDRSNHWIDETFEITVKNRKENEAVEIRVVEHLYRWTNWEIRESSHEFTKADSQTIEFRIPLKAGEEKKITYTAHYSW